LSAPGSADRKYVNQEEWQAAVLEMLEAARYVIIQPAKRGRKGVESHFRPL
jgi:hypothetical protein